MAQEKPKPNRKPKPSIEKNDSLGKPEDTVFKDSVSFGEKGDIETTVVYSARDSIRFDVVRRIMFLYGEAKIVYGDVELEAAYVEVDWKNNTLRAHALADSAGNVEGIPIFTDKGTNYNADSIYYNFKSQKGIVKGIVTQQGEGFLQAGTAKKLADGTMYNDNSLYTTCDLKDPHYAIRASKLKLNPNKNVVAGPFNLIFNGIPTPLGFAFGMFPIPDEKASGIIIPTYGEAQDRGFFLRDGGFYWAINDYMSARILGQIYSKGGWGSTLDLDYKKRYAYSGNLNVSYNKVLRESGEVDPSVTKDFWLRWNHSPTPRGNSRFSANVNFGTSTFNQNNSLIVQDFLSSSFNSSVSYSRTFQGTPFSMSANLRHNQNIQTDIVKVFPDLNISMNRIFPFKKMVANSKSPLAQLNVGYSFNSKMDITNDLRERSFGFETIQEDFVDLNDTLAFNTSNASVLLDRAPFGATHRIPISTQITILKYFQITPSLSYDEFWYPKRLNYEWDDTEEKVVVTEQDGFQRAYQFQTSMGASTSFYAFYYFKEKSPIKAIRQTITPSASVGYRPDFTDPKYDYYQTVQTDTNGTMQTLSRYQGFLFGAPSGGKSESFNISLETMFEAKVKDKADTVKGEKKLQLLRASTSYDVLADSFNLSNINFTTNAKVWKDRISLTLRGNIDPYGYQAEYNEDGEFESQTRLKSFAWQNNQGIGLLRQMTISASTRLSPEGLKSGGNPVASSRAEGQNPKQAILDDIEAHPERYIDFNIPWSLSLNYNVGYSRIGLDEASITQALNFSGDLSLTEKWKVTFNSGYDFELKDFSFTSLGINRDLHCWQMAVNWIPFGPRQSYTLDIRVKASVLQDLKVSKRNFWFDR